ncbi:hypothetical protein XAP6164_1030033 [Xanthomonas phaseoli pv. phaseoli]|nr:hypothetical protein XAP6164_1030033 [Xanthomonas phaseoli pv. phaseoli]
MSQGVVLFGRRARIAGSEHIPGRPLSHRTGCAGGAIRSCRALLKEALPPPCERSSTRRVAHKRRSGRAAHAAPCDDHARPAVGVVGLSVALRAAIVDVVLRQRRIRRKGRHQVRGCILCGAQRGQLIADLQGLVLEGVCLGLDPVADLVGVAAEHALDRFACRMCAKRRALGADVDALLGHALHLRVVAAHRLTLRLVQVNRLAVDAERAIDADGGGRQAIALERQALADKGHAGTIGLAGDVDGGFGFAATHQQHAHHYRRNKHFHQQFPHILKEVVICLPALACCR